MPFNYVGQANQFNSSILMTGTSNINQYGVDFGFQATRVELYHDTTGLAFAFSLGSSVASTNGPFAFQSEKRDIEIASGVRKIGLCTLTTTTSTAAAGVAQIRVQAWG
jgi:hypothetical protein